MFTNILTHIHPHCSGHWQMVVIVPKEHLIVWCHTLISSGDYYLLTCNLWLAALRYLASFVAQ